MKKDRGQFLTILLVLATIMVIKDLYEFISSGQLTSLLDNPFNGPVYWTLLNEIVYISALVGIWLWKKWSVYLLFTLAGLGVISLLYNLFSIYILHTIELDQINTIVVLGGSFISILVVVIWYQAIRKKWQYFN